MSMQKININAFDSKSFSGNKFGDDTTYSIHVDSDQKYIVTVDNDGNFMFMKTRVTVLEDTAKLLYHLACIRGVDVAAIYIIKGGEILDSYSESKSGK